MYRVLGCRVLQTGHTGIRIDQCPTCQGIWLEKSELSSIPGHLDEGAMLFLYQLTAHAPLI